jgi:DNA-binding transcriptional LysR family regulator
VLGGTVARFRQMHPEIDIRVRLSEHLLDLVDESVDVALRLANFADSSMILRRVADVERVLCAAPAYIAARGAPPTPHQLAGHSCLLLRFPGSQQFRWPLARRGEEPVAWSVSGPMDADDGDLITDWALAGHGIALKPVFEVAGHLAARRLVKVLPDHQPTPLTLGVVYLSRQLVPQKIRHFAEALVDDAAAHVRGELSKLA